MVKHRLSIPVCRCFVACVLQFLCSCVGHSVQRPVMGNTPPWIQPTTGQPIPWIQPTTGQPVPWIQPTTGQPIAVGPNFRVQQNQDDPEESSVSSNSTSTWLDWWKDVEGTDAYQKLSELVIEPVLAIFGMVAVGFLASLCPGYLRRAKNWAAQGDETVAFDPGGTDDVQPNIIAIGVTGVGKSQLLNALADEDVFAVGDGIDRVTACVSNKIVEAHLVNPNLAYDESTYPATVDVNLIDSIGGDDSRGDERSVDTLLHDLFRLRRLNLILVVGNDRENRLKDGCKQYLTRIASAFGQDMWGFVVIVLTNYDRCFNANASAQDQKKQAWQDKMRDEFNIPLNFQPIPVYFIDSVIASLSDERIEELGEEGHDTRRIQMQRKEFKGILNELIWNAWFNANRGLFFPTCHLTKPTIHPWDLRTARWVVGAPLDGCPMLYITPGLKEFMTVLYKPSIGLKAWLFFDHEKRTLVSDEVEWFDDKQYIEIEVRVGYRHIEKACFYLRDVQPEYSTEDALGFQAELSKAMTSKVYRLDKHLEQDAEHALADEANRKFEELGLHDEALRNKIVATAVRDAMLVWFERQELVLAAEEHWGPWLIVMCTRYGARSWKFVLVVLAVLILACFGQHWYYTYVVENGCAVSLCDGRGRYVLKDGPLPLCGQTGWPDCTQDRCCTCQKGHHEAPGTGMDTQCSPNVCLCDHGDPAVGPQCPQDGSVGCVRVDKGFHEVGNDMPTENVCECNHGIGGKGQNCPVHNTYACVQCDSHFDLVKGKCVPGEGYKLLASGKLEANACSCRHGFPVKPGPKCPSQHFERCGACRGGYALYETRSTTTCSLKSDSYVVGYDGKPKLKDCTCSYGTAAHGNECPEEGSEFCLSCGVHYRLRGGKCYFTGHTFFEKYVVPFVVSLFWGSVVVAVVVGVGCFCRSLADDQLAKTKAAGELYEKEKARQHEERLQQGKQRSDAALQQEKQRSEERSKKAERDDLAGMVEKVFTGQQQLALGGPARTMELGTNSNNSGYKEHATLTAGNTYKAIIYKADGAN